MRKQNIVNRPFALDAAEDYRTKATLGITGWLRLRVHIDGAVRHLDVGSTYPGAGEGPKGLAVRQLKSYASWVQTVQEWKCRKTLQLLDSLNPIEHFSFKIIQISRSVLIEDRNSMINQSRRSCDESRIDQVN